jgi:hypothetical protein
LIQVRTDRDDAAQARPLPDACPFSLDELLGKPPNLAALSAKLAQAPAA